MTDGKGVAAILATVLGLILAAAYLAYGQGRELLGVIGFVLLVAGAVAGWVQWGPR